MKKYYLLGLVLALGLVGQQVLAFNTTINNELVPYEPVVVEGEVGIEREYLGELKGDPHIYEFTVSTTTDLKLQLLQPSESVDSSLGFILIQKNTEQNNVSEIGRVNQNNATWESWGSNAFGISLAQVEFTKKIRPAVYSLEISSENNQGKYMLIIGSESAKAGYFSDIKDIREIQQFFNKSAINLLKSSYVYYPIGILVLLVLIYLTWRRHNKLKVNNA